MAALNIAFSYFALISLGFIDNSRGALYPSMLDFFALSKDQGALIFSLASLSSFVATLFSKFWLRSLGATKATKWALWLDILFCVGAFFCGADQYFIFLLLSIIFGFSLGVKSIGVNLIVNQNYHGDKKRRVFAGLHSMYGLASLAAPLFVNLLFQQGASWQRIMLLMAFFPLLTLFGFRKLKGTVSLNKNTPKNNSFSGDRKILIAVCIALSCYVSCEIILSSRLVLYLQEIEGFSPQAATTYLMLYFAGLLVGRLLFTAISFKISNLNLLRFSIIGTMALIYLGISGSPICFCLSGLTMSAFFPCFMDFISEISLPEDTEYMISRAMQTVGAALVSFHYIFGLIATSFSLVSAFSLPLVLGGIVLVILLGDRNLVKAVHFV